MSHNAGGEPVLPAKKVPGLGFKNAAAAERTLRALHGRDPFYQKKALSGLMAMAKQVLRRTRKDRKIINIIEAMSVFDKFLDDFASRRVSKRNNKYLSLGTVRKAEELAGDNITEQQKSFIAAYSSVRGQYQRLRNVRAQDEDTTWDIVRNRELKSLKRKLAHAQLFDDGGKPTEAHTEMLLWAYSPDRRKLWEYYYKPWHDAQRDREIDIDIRGSSEQDEESDGDIRRSKRITEKTISNVKEAVATLERSLRDLREQNSSKQNPYLSLDIVRKVEELAGDSITELQKSFIAAYSSVAGEYKRLRSMLIQDEDSTWDIVRNRELKLLKEKHAGAKLFTDDDEPTAEHMEMLLWAYSPNPKRVAKEFNFFETKEMGAKERESDKSDKDNNSDENEKKHMSDKSCKKRINSSDTNDQTGRMPRRSKRIKQ